jgi:alkanesulfonate monooxygenase SsuD/methylene tetrahydromethanopterin reductase-like flavin-dependent oxidoreductase (luciferase family)
VGRDPATLERTVAVLVDLSGGRGVPASISSGDTPALTGSPEEIADTLRAFAREGIAHVQAHVVPMTLAGVERFAPVLDALDRQ